MITGAATTFVTVVEDSRRWEHIEPRSDDIVVSTPPKSGTTWTQGILRSMLFAAEDWPLDPPVASPWVDARFTPIDELVDLLEAQEHRRFIKTHSPGTATPFDDRLDYVVVYRDGRDALVSWANHRRALRPEVVSYLNALSAEDGVDPIPEAWSGDYDELFDEWEVFCSPTMHLASWWTRRHLPNVHFVHYNDLKADLDGEMRRLADGLSIDVPEDRWPVVVERCGLTEMRESARALDLDQAFEGGADAFFYKGTNGRWRDVLTDAQLDRYRRLVDSDLTVDAAEWLEHGSVALGRRPDD